MATILDNDREKEISSGKTARREWNESFEVAQAERNSSRIEGDQIGEYRVVFVVYDSKFNHRAFDFAIQTARKFSSPLALVYLAPRGEVPEDYREFALIEGMRDYEWHYYSWLAAEKLGQLG